MFCESECTQLNFKLCVCGWAQKYCRHIVALACLSCCLFGLSLKYASEMSLWKAKIKTLFLHDIMSTVWVHGSKTGTKGLVVVHGPWAESISVSPCIYNSHPIRHTSKKKRSYTEEVQTLNCHVRVTDVSVEFSDPANKVLCTSSSVCMLMHAVMQIRCW